jgi:MFS family permease
MKSLSFLRNDRNLQVICLIDLVASIGQACTIPILPIYVRSFGVSYSIVGLVIAGAGISRFFIDIPVGFFFDRIGRKPFLRLSMLLLGTSTLLPIFSGGIAQLLIFQLLQGAGVSIMMIGVLTVVGDISPHNRRGSYVGYLFASDSLGVAIGAFAGGKLVEIGGFRIPFIAMLVFSIIAALVVELLFHESMPSESEARRPTITSIAKSGRNVIVAFAAAAAVSLLTGGTGNTAIPLYALSLLMSPFQIGLIVTVVFLANVIIMPWSGGMCDRAGTKRVFVVGFILAAISSLLFILSKQFYPLAAIGALFGLSIGIASSANAAIVVESSGENSRGVSIAIYRIFRDVGSILGPVMVGASSDLLGIYFAFVLSAIICVAIAMLGLGIRKTIRQRSAAT